MKQRKTQTSAYWQKEFQFGLADVERISNKILEENRILALDEIGASLVSHYAEIEEREMAELREGKLYQPKEHYEPDEQVYFPQLDFAVGTIKYVRSGQHPDHEKFSVIGVTFKESSNVREFVADFPYNHSLNANAENGLSDGSGLSVPDEVYQTHSKIIRPTVKNHLDTLDEFVQFQDLYFLKDLLPEFQEGLFNIADAAIDISDGPLEIDNLIEQMGLTDEDGNTNELTRFLVNHKLAHDERFVDVGSKGKVRWYLQRLQPNEAINQPTRLQYEVLDYDINQLSHDLQTIVSEIDDEATYPDDMPSVDAISESTRLALIYPHRRSGTLPITPKLTSFFPTSDYNPVLIEFVDGRSGDTFPGWVVSEHGYIYGLSEWYDKYDLPVGVLITLKKTDLLEQFIIDYETVRGQRDWIRQASVASQKLSFRMNTGSINCKYDELLMIDEADTGKIDELWQKSKDNQITVLDALNQVFPELAKLSPQSTVHAKTLYTAVNLLCRATPGVVFQELVSQDRFIDMDHGYWGYNPALKD